MGIYPCGERDGEEMSPSRKEFVGILRGTFFFVAGMKMGSQNLKGNSPLSSLSPFYKIGGMNPFNILLLIVGL